MTKKYKRVYCTVEFYYDPESYLFEWDQDEDVPDEEILRRCKEMMTEDLNEGGFAETDWIKARFANE